MKRIYTILVAIMLTASVFAQAPEKMSYQAVIRNASDQLVTNQGIGMQISVLQGSATGTAVYVETINTTTNTNGLVTVEIGGGTVVSGDFTTIDWASDVYYIKTETDPTTAGGTVYTITGTSQLLSVPYSMHAKTTESIAAMAIGDSYGGGIVFWLDASGQHGLIAAGTDQSTGIIWSDGFTETAATGDGVGAGEMNTMLIVSEQRDGSYAAQLCADLVITDGGIDYGDWYLPSRYELNLMYLQKVTIGGFSDDYYWSSTEHATNHAREQRFSDGNQAWEGKNIQSDVRAVRAF